MAKYHNLRKESALTSVEFSSGQNGHYAFLYLRDGSDKEKITQWLSVGAFEIIAKTAQNDQSVLVVKTTQAPEQILSSLSQMGESLTAEIPTKKFEAWKWRGMLSMAGQGLDATSYYLAAKRGTRSKGDNVAYLLFATFNIAASLLNITFGAKQIPDPHRVRYLKAQINEALQPYAAEPLPTPDSVAPKLEEERPKSTREKIRDYIRSHSIYIDMGLRTFGNINLIFPVNKWKEHGWRNRINDNPFTRNAGISLMTGKIFTIFSKVPDPYNPAPQSTLDKAREKIFFKADTAIESLSAVLMGYNSFVGKKDANGVRKNNPISGFASVFLLGGWAARFVAPVGVRKVDLPEVEAHVTECLAKVPREKLPQLIADVSAGLKNNLKDQPIEFGQIYTQILDKLERARQTKSPDVPEIKSVEASPGKTSLATDGLRRKPIAATPLHIDHAEKSPGASLSV